MKKIIAIIFVVLLGIGCLVLLGRVIELAPQVQYEKSLTPSPSPIYGNTLAETPEPDAPTAAPVLKNGSSGEAVLQAQQRLQALGYYTGSLDGQYGPGTASAVTAFQQQHGLDADGKLGTATAALLYSDDARPMITMAPTAVSTATPAPTSAPTAQVV